MKAIKEIIVVEGKDDVAAVQAAVDAQCIQTRGYSYGDKLVKILKEAQKRRGVIILTDPDYMGEKIRKDLAARVPGVKHAFIATDLALKEKNIGVENAKPQDILDALEKAQATLDQEEEIFSQEDLLKAGLVAGKMAAERRRLLGKRLHLGQCNGKQLLKRLNAFGISREEFEEQVKKLYGK